MSRKLRSTPFRTPPVGLPIAVAALAVALSIALLVGWTIIIVQYSELSQRFAEHSWLLPTGICAFVLIVAVVVVGSIFLVRQMLESRRQVQFIDSVTHELKSPLASIRLGLETLARPKLPDGQREKLRCMMLEDVERLTVFIDGVLQASRLPVDHSGTTIDDIDVHKLLCEAVERVGRRHNVSEDCFSIEVGDDVSLRSDWSALDTIITNLLDNSVKYSETPPRIEVFARMTEDSFELRVTDHGIGVPRAHLSRIFERFHRVPSARVNARKGTGLGLYVVHSLVEHLGGRLTAKSDGADTGTEMTMNLPGARRAA